LLADKKFHSLALSYLEMLDCSTRSAEVTEFLKKSLESFNIPLDKIRSVCTDGGRIAVKSCKNVFGDIYHTVCVNKNLNDVVNKSLITLSSLEDLISKYNAIVNFFKQSNIDAKLRKKQMKKSEIPLSKTVPLIECNVGCWKTINKALERFQLLLPDVKSVLASLSSSGSQPDVPKLDDATVTSLTEIQSLLGDFDMVSDYFSGSSDETPNSGAPTHYIDFLMQCMWDHEIITSLITKQLRRNLSKELKKGFKGTLSSTLLVAAYLVEPR
jgi:hypothetical protein